MRWMGLVGLLAACWLAGCGEGSKEVTVGPVDDTTRQQYNQIMQHLQQQQDRALQRATGGAMQTQPTQPPAEPAG